ncbi:unnamed protein product [Caenorhabditis bovis]|uniref:Adenylate kinase active site lid domain-containing protein n=1 Tax=Caenorhabditis bovis TaxID=2654633 RepID=A0A8S1EWU5_9PELO|nr:unnamed protein product [Caenorhabditis bovis]
MYRVLLSGPAGSGKGTITKMLVREFEPYGFAHFAAGELIRDHIARGTEFGLRAKAFLNKGEHVPDSLLNGAVLAEMIKAGPRVILDGYPRNLNQVKMVEEQAPLQLVVELKVPRKVLIDRLSKQLVHPASGRAYNLEVNPPREEGKDDLTGEPLFKRSEDQLEVARRRLEVYDKTENKVIEYYKKQNKCITLSGDSSNAVFESVADIIRRDLPTDSSASGRTAFA